MVRMREMCWPPQTLRRQIPRLTWELRETFQEILLQVPLIGWVIVSQVGNFNSILLDLSISCC